MGEWVDGWWDGGMGGWMDGGMGGWVDGWKQNNTNKMADLKHLSDPKSCQCCIIKKVDMSDWSDRLSPPEVLVVFCSLFSKDCFWV